MQGRRPELSNEGGLEAQFRQEMTRRNRAGLQGLSRLETACSCVVHPCRELVVVTYAYH